MARMELSNKQQLIIDAIRKADQGKEMRLQGDKMVEEGMLEFHQLTAGTVPSSGGRNVTKAVKKMAKKSTKPSKSSKPSKSPVTNNKHKGSTKEAAKKIPEAVVEDTARKIIEVISNDDYSTNASLRSKLGVGFYLIDRATKLLISNNEAHFVKKPHPKTHVPHNYLIPS